MFKLALVFSSFLCFFSCGAEKTPEQIDRANNNIEGTNRNLKEIVTFLDELKNQSVLVFNKNLVDERNSQVVVNTKALDGSTRTLSLDTNQLEVYDDYDSQESYYVVPKNLEQIVDKRFTKRIIRNNSLFYELKESLIAILGSDSEVDSIFDKDKSKRENELASRLYSERKECEIYQKKKGRLDGIISNSGFFDFRQRKRAKEMLFELEQKYAYLECENILFSSMKEINEKEKEHQIEWEKFSSAWEDFYSNFKKYHQEFPELASKKLLLPTITSPYVKGLRDIYIDSYPNKMGMVELFEDKIISLKGQKLKDFFVSKSKLPFVDLDIVKENPFRFESLEIKHVNTLREFFIVMFKASNSSEKMRVKKFIAEAVFVMYELQIEKDIIKKSKSMLLSNRLK